MITLKERFEKEFGSYYTEGTGFLYGGIETNRLLSFFRQELLALAEEVENKCQEPYSEFEKYNDGLNVASISIRSKADSLN